MYTNFSMKTLAKLWDGFLTIFGLKKNSKYVKGYLNEANMRSGIFMSAVVFVLEGWLIIRQTQKYIIPNIQKLIAKNQLSFSTVFQTIFQNTSNFFLLMFFGVAMFVYCLQYIGKNKSFKKVVIACFVFCHADHDGGTCKYCGEKERRIPREA